MPTEKEDQTEATKRRLCRAECKIRDLTVEIKHMEDIIGQCRLDSQMEYVNSPQFSPNPPENEHCWSRKTPRDCSKSGESCKVDHKLQKLSSERLEIVNFLIIKFISYPFSTKPNQYFMP